MLISKYLYTLLKPKRHSLRCHDFMVHALPLRMFTNVVDFRVMRRLCRREWNWLWNWQSVNQHSWDPWQRTTWSRCVWRLTLTAYWYSRGGSRIFWGGGGGAKDSAQSAMSSTVGVWKLLSHAIWALFWSTLKQNWIKQNTVDQSYGGGRLDPPLYNTFHSSNRKLLQLALNKHAALETPREYFNICTSSSTSVLQIISLKTVSACFPKHRVRVVSYRVPIGTLSRKNLHVGCVLTISVSPDNVSSFCSQCLRGWKQRFILSRTCRYHD